MSPPSSAHVSAHATRLLRHVLQLLVPLSLALTVYLYLYPFFLTCGFPLPSSTASPHAQDGLSAWIETVKQHLPLPTPANDSSTTSSQRIAPFRLLALGDPQLEGDTSIPNYYLATSFPHLHDFAARLATDPQAAFHALVDFYFEDVPHTLESVRKRIDLWGNDFYLAHIYRTLRWWARPTHVAVLGDLLGSQWISDDEFARRGERYWRRAFRGGQRVPDEVEVNILGDDGIWTERLLHVAGNHDIGYAGDLTRERLERFERVFGKANYDVRFTLPVAAADAAEDVLMPPELRIVVLNDMNLDTPALVPELQDDTYNFINEVINSAVSVETRGHFTVVLTHVPLYKAEGLCVDAPFFTFHDHDGTLKEQNQLSADASRGFLEGIFGLSGDREAPGGGWGRRGVIVNGHDHEGCDTWHFINQSLPEEERAWQASKWQDVQQQQQQSPGVREITVRSMMGGYGGNAGLLSAWFDEDAWEWRFGFANCALGTQYVWWAVHVVDFIAVVLAIVYGVLVLTAGDTKTDKKKEATGNGHVPEPNNGGVNEITKP